MTLGIVGHGSFGQFVERVVRERTPEIAVRVCSRRYEADGKRFVTLEEVGQCDAVVLACAISEFEETLERVQPHLLPTTVLIDIATVKEHTVAALKRTMPAQPFLATHPMFGPYSYDKKEGDMTGFRLVVAEHSLADDVIHHLTQRLTALGLVLLSMTPEEHDRLLAETLFLTHYVGQVVTEGGFTRTDIDTVSFGFLMDAVESVRQDTALFRDVYRYNRFCEEVLNRFDEAETRVHEGLKRTVR